MQPVELLNSQKQKLLIHFPLFSGSFQEGNNDSAASKTLV